MSGVPVLRRLLPGSHYDGLRVAVGGTISHPDKLRGTPAALVVTTGVDCAAVLTPLAQIGPTAAS